MVSVCGVGCCVISMIRRWFVLLGVVLFGVYFVCCIGLRVELL